MTDYPVPREGDLVAVLKGFNVELVRITPPDYDFLDSTFSDPRVIIGWRPRGGIVAPDEFVRHLWHGVLTQYLIKHRDRSERLGLVSVYNADHRNGAAWLSVVRDCPVDC